MTKEQALKTLEVLRTTDQDQTIINDKIVTRKICQEVINMNSDD